jgi:hypothetical protein
MLTPPTPQPRHADAFAAAIDFMLSSPCRCCRDVAIERCCRYDTLMPVASAREVIAAAVAATMMMLFRRHDHAAIIFSCRYAHFEHHACQRR